MENRIRIRSMEGADLAAVLSWRNRPDVRRFMLTQHEITLDEHRAWFDRRSRDTSYSLLIAEENGLPLGFVHFSGVEPGGIFDWGFYTTPDAPRGSGQKLGKAALQHAFDTLRAHKICGQVLDDNDASMRLHERLGFQREGVLRQHAPIAGQYHDLVCFGLLREDWNGEKR